MKVKAGIFVKKTNMWIWIRVTKISLILRKLSMKVLGEVGESRNSEEERANS